MTRKRKHTPKVVRLEAKRNEKLLRETEELARRWASAEDEQVALVVAAYRKWEQDNPDAALQPKHKLAMVRLGFVGPGGFDRCHEPHRRPMASFFAGQDDDDFSIPAELESDRDASEVLMCPAMEARSCQGVWSGMRTPPCYLLLLEVHQGLGGGMSDDRVSEVLADYGKWQGPEKYAESFVRAEQLLRRRE